MFVNFGAVIGQSMLVAVEGNIGIFKNTDNAYYTDAVRWAAENNIVSGISDDEFAPNIKITREQMAAIIYRYAK